MRNRMGWLSIRTAIRKCRMPALVVFILFISGLATGCSSKPRLMPTPTVYTEPAWNPFADVPPALQGNKVDVMYVTDRVPEKESPDLMEYGLKRSRSAAFGVAQIQIGKDDLTWDDLVSESRTARRSQKLELKTISMREMGRFPITPPRLVVSDAELARPHLDAEASTDPASKLFIEELIRRLAATPRKEVFIYIHGFNTTLEGGVTTLAEIWHFLGHEGVPIAYSWPAGVGTLRAYGYTEQSGQFTIFHLKETLRLIASCPAVEKINVIAHSRGTDVATTALRELHIETRDTANTREKFKLGTIALAAADLDVDVAIQRIATERVGRAAERVAIYLHGGDKALSLSN